MAGRVSRLGWPSCGICTGLGCGTAVDMSRAGAFGSMHGSAAQPEKEEGGEAPPLLGAAEPSNS